MTLRTFFFQISNFNLVSQVSYGITKNVESMQKFSKKMLGNFTISLEKQAVAACLFSLVAAAKAAAARVGTTASLKKKMGAQQLEFVLSGHRFLSYQLTECSSSSEQKQQSSRPKLPMTQFSIGCWPQLPSLATNVVAPPLYRQNAAVVFQKQLQLNGLKCVVLLFSTLDSISPL